MAEVMNSLFGITPESLIAQREAKAQQEAMQYAQLADPFARANYQIYKGASGLGNQLAGMLGAQDPEMMRITQRQQLVQQAQPKDATGWQALAQQLYQSGDTPGAQEAMAKAQALKTSALTVEKIQSEIEKNKAEAVKDLRIPTPTDVRTPEEKNAATYALTQGTVNSPEYKSAFSDKFAELITKEGAKPTKVGITSDGTQRAVYSDGKTQFVFGNDPEGKLVKKNYVGGVDQTTAKTNVSVGDKGKSAFVEKLNELDAKKVAAAIEARENAIGMQDSLNNLANLNDTALISGSFASGRIGAANLLSTLNLVNDTDKNTLANSESYQKISGDAVLRMLGGKLGSGFSNDDRKFIIGLVPQLENSLKARRQLVNFMTQKNKKIVTEADNLETYARANDGLKGYKSTLVFSSPASSSSQYSGLSNDELEARIKRAQETQAK
jgi:hypothetical protein